MGRPNNQGYPIRGILRGDFLYLRNYEPTRWPVGNPETGYPNTDGSPTKSITIEARNSTVGTPDSRSTLPTSCRLAKWLESSSSAPKPPR